MPKHDIQQDVFLIERRCSEFPSAVWLLKETCALSGVRMWATNSQCPHPDDESSQQTTRRGNMKELEGCDRWMMQYCFVIIILIIFFNVEQRH